MRTAAVALLASAAVAVPTLPKRQSYSEGDVTILNYALTLERLESKFYRDAIAQFSDADFAAAGFPAPFYSNLQSISAEEDTHAAFLASALESAGATPVQECTYDFGYTDPKSFVMTSSIIEGVGVSAYLGAAQDISSPDYLTAAAQIAPIEARHTAYIRKQLGEAGMPQPFDTPLGLNQVYTLASPFIVSCPPSNPPLPVKAFPSVMLATTGPLKAGQTITLTTPAMGATNAAFLSLNGPVFQAAQATEGGYTTTIPPNFGGQTYIVLTNSAGAVSDANTVAGPAAVEVAEVY